MQQFDSEFEQKIWNSYKEKLVKEQSDPYIEKVYYTPSENQKDLNDAIKGGWDELLVEMEENNFDYLYENNLATRKRIFEDTLFEFKSEVRSYYDSLPQSEKDEMDEDDFQSSLFEKFEELINNDEIDLRDGYTQISCEWSGSENIRFEVTGRGSDSPGHWFDDVDHEIRPNKEMIGLLELFNIAIEDFRRSMTENVFSDDEFQQNADDESSAIEVFNILLDRSLKDFETTFGEFKHDSLRPPSVTADNFAEWLHNTYSAGEELGASGFAITIEMDGDELTELCESVAYIKGNAVNRNVEDFLYKISIGKGAELYCAEGSVSMPLTLNNALEFVTDDSISVDRDFDGVSVDWHFVNLEKTKALHAVTYGNLYANEEKYGINSDYFQNACKNLDLNPMVVSKLGDKKDLVLGLGAKERCFEIKDLYCPLNPDLLDYLKTEEGRNWGVKEKTPAANLLVYAAPFERVAEFVRESNLPLDAQDAKGNNALHCLLNKNTDRYMYNIIEKSASWVNKNTLFAKNNEGVSPLDIYTKVYNRINNPLPEVLIQAFDAAGVQWNVPIDIKIINDSKSLAQIFKIEEHDFVQRQKLRERVGIAATDVLSIRSAL